MTKFQGYPAGQGHGLGPAGSVPSSLWMGRRSDVISHLHSLWLCFHLATKFLSANPMALSGAPVHPGCEKLEAVEIPNVHADMSPPLPPYHARRENSPKPAFFFQVTHRKSDFFFLRIIQTHLDFLSYPRPLDSELEAGPGRPPTQGRSIQSILYFLLSVVQVLSSVWVGRLILMYYIFSVFQLWHEVGALCSVK